MAASPEFDSELMPSWLKFLSVYLGTMCCAFGLIGVITRTTSRGTNTPAEEPGKCGALRACFTWVWSNQPGRPCWVTVLIKCLTLTCASTCSVAIGLSFGCGRDESFAKSDDVVLLGWLRLRYRESLVIKDKFEVTNNFGWKFIETVLLSCSYSAS